LHNIYNTVDIPDELKINDNDISQLKNIKDKNELETKVNDLQTKIQNL
jgi:hypothetical protein